MTMYVSESAMDAVIRCKMFSFKLQKPLISLFRLKVGNCMCSTSGLAGQKCVWNSVIELIVSLVPFHDLQNMNVLICMNGHTVAYLSR
jgi:hypothetical protein